MIEINLLQEQKKKAGPAAGGRPRKKFEPQKSLIFALLGIAVAAVAAVDFKFYTDLKKVQGELDSVNDELKSIEHKRQLDDAIALQAELDTLNRKKAIIVDLIDNRIHWSKKLGNLRDSLPSDIWIERVELTNPGNTRDDPFQTLQIGAATTNYQRGYARVAETIERLDASEDFMHGFLPPLIDTEIKNERWDPSGRDESVDAMVCRFTFEAKRPLPESETTQNKR